MIVTEPEVVNVHEAKTHLSKLLERAHAGEEIILAKAGKPYARLMPLASKRRRGGQLPGLGRRARVLRAVARGGAQGLGRRVNEAPARHARAAVVVGPTRPCCQRAPARRSQTRTWLSS